MFENGVVQAGGRTAVLCMLSSVVTDSLGPHGQRSLEKNAGESELPRKPKNTGVSSLSLLQGIFLTQESNLGLLHCRRILY